MLSNPFLVPAASSPLPRRDRNWAACRRSSSCTSSCSNVASGLLHNPATRSHRQKQFYSTNTATGQDVSRHCVDSEAPQQLQGSGSTMLLQQQQQQQQQHGQQQQQQRPRQQHGQQQLQRMPPTCSRRGLASTTAAALLWGSSSLPAWALRTVELRDGATADVYEHGMTLEIVALRGSIPQQWIVEFRQVLGKYAGFQLGQRKELQELFSELSKPTEKRSAGAADVITLGDSWLAPAIRQRLVQPLPSAETYRWWRRLPHRWQQLVRRHPHTGQLSESGPIWGCPYRWGAMLLAYKRDLLLRPRSNAQPIRTWSDLLQPALKGRVAFPDNPREFLGIAFKTFDNPLLGFNATRADLAAAGVSADDVRERVRQLKRQALLFSSDEHVRALIAGDAWVCIGTSTDIVPAAERMNVELLAPGDGTLLWADVWVVPTHAQHGHLQAGPSPILPSWLEFSISPARSEILNGLKAGATPLLLPPSAEEHAARVAAAAAATASSQPEPTSSSSASSSRRWFGSNKAKQQEQQEQQQQHLQEQRQQQELLQRQLLEQQQQELYSAAVSAAAPELRLLQANHYMPPDSVLELSEFSIPLDSDTLDLYNWLLS